MVNIIPSINESDTISPLRISFILSGPIMSSSTTQTTVNRQQLYRLTFGILNANSLHFIPISLLFLPLTFAAVKLYSSVTDFTTNVNLILTVKTLITVIAFSFSVILPTVAGVALITYSTNQIIHRKPLTFSSTVKSLSQTFIPVLHTLIAGFIKLIIIFLAFTLLSIELTKAVKSLGLDSDLFFFSTFVNSTVSFALAITITFFIVIWGSAAAITVLESKSGFEALRQSANQSTEFRNHSFSIVFLTGFGIGSALANSTVFRNSEPTPNWIWILRVGIVYLDPLLMILLYVVANSVLYVQCKVASGGEVAMATVEGEVSGEYVRVGVNDKDGEVFHERVNEAGNGGFSYMLYLSIVVSLILLFRSMYDIFMLMNKHK